MVNQPTLSRLCALGFSTAWTLPKQFPAPCCSFPQSALPFALPAPGSPPDWEHPEGRQRCPAVPRTSREALAVGCGLWAVGGRPPGQPSLSPLVGTAGLPQGGEGVGAADRPAREGAVRPCSLTRQLGCPAPQARPPFPLPLVTSGFLPDCPPAQPFSAEQPEGSGTPLATWWGAGMPQRLRRTVQRCLRR